MEKHQLAIKKKFNCSKHRLFELWSNPELVAKWFFAKSGGAKSAEFESQFTIKGHYNLVMIFDEARVQIHGDYLDITRYSFISFTWNSHISKDTTVKLTFTELSPNRSELLLEHSVFESDESREQHNQGWGFCLENLDSFVNMDEPK